MVADCIISRECHESCSHEKGGRIMNPAVEKEALKEK
jgi:hypothetical protein